jgi:glycosyltransferase involved in cell wall biosynthesis
MKLLYATSIDLPSTRANRIQIVSMARAFAAQLGDNFVLGLRENAGESLACDTAVLPGSRSYKLAWQYMGIARERGITHVFCREEKLLLLMLVYNALWFRLPLKFIYELHHFWHTGLWYRTLLRWVDGIVAITHGLKAQLVTVGYKEEKIFVSPDAVDIMVFDAAFTKEEARTKLGLPHDRKIALYAGAIEDPWKGAGVFYGSAVHLPDTYLLVIVGGKPLYVEKFLREYPAVPSVRMEGYKDYYKELPVYLKAADVLVVPNSGKEDISRISTSPLKVFAYMAAGRPMVASDLPSIREVLNGSNAVLVEADNPQALARGIATLAEDPALANHLAAQARKDVEVYTWDARAKTILNFICSR